MFNDLTPVGCDISELAEDTIKELLGGISTSLKTRGHAMRFIQDIEELAYRHASEIVNFHRPPQAPKVERPRLYFQGSGELLWDVDGWEIVYIIGRDQDYRDEYHQRIYWTNPAGETFELESGVLKKFRFPSSQSNEKGEELSFWPEPVLNDR
jgi:hypothetical protein